MKLLNRIAALIMCLALLATGMAFAEGGEQPEPTATASAAPETTAPASEAPTAPASEAPETTAPASEAPTAPASEAPTAPASEAPETTAPVSEAPTAPASEAPETTAPVAIKLEFAEERLEYELSDIDAEFDYEKEFEFDLTGADSIELVWSSSDETVAAFVEYDKDGELADEQTPEEDIVIRFEAYAPGKTVIRAEKEDDASVFDEFDFIIKQPETRLGAPAPDLGALDTVSSIAYASSSADIFSNTTGYSLAVYANGGTDPLPAALISYEITDGSAFATVTGGVLAPKLDASGRLLSGTASCAVKVKAVYNGTNISCEGTFTFHQALTSVSLKNSTLMATAAQPNVSFELVCAPAAVSAQEYFAYVSLGSSLKTNCAVDVNSIAKPLAIGEMNLTLITTSGQTFTLPAYVSPEATDVNITAPSTQLTYAVGQSVDLGVTLVPEASREGVVWSVVGGGGAFDADVPNRLRFIAPGFAVVRATTLSGACYDQVTFTVINLENIELDGTATNVFSSDPGFALKVLSGGLEIDQSLFNFEITAGGEYASISEGKLVPTVDAEGLLAARPTASVTVKATLKSNAAVTAERTYTLHQAIVSARMDFNIAAAGYAFNSGVTYFPAYSEISPLEGFAVKNYDCSFGGSAVTSFTVGYASGACTVSTASYMGGISGQTFNVDTLSGQSLPVISVVETAPATALAIAAPAKLPAPGQSAQFGASVTPATSLTPIIWESSDETIAVFSDETPGLLTILKPGDCVITARAFYGAATDTYALSAGSVSSIAFTSPAVMYSDNALALSVADENGVIIGNDFITYTLRVGASAFASIDNGQVTAVTTDGLLASGLKNAVVMIDAVYCAGTQYEKKTSCALDIRQAVTSVEFGEDDFEAILGMERELAPTILPATAYDTTLTYEISDPGIATLRRDTATGKWYLKGEALGECVLTVTTSSGKEIAFDVDVIKGTFTLTILVPSDASAKVGGSVDLTVVTDPVDATDGYSWKSSDPQVAVMDENIPNRVKFLKKGAVTLTATALSGAHASVTFTVVQPVTKITNYDDVFTTFPGYVLGAGYSTQMYLNVLPLDANDRGYTVTSSNELVAYVMNNRIYARSEGTANITIASNDGAFSRVIPVKVVPRKKAITYIRIGASKVTLYEGKTKNVSKSVNSAAYTRTVYWGTSNPAVAQVSQAGKITAVGPGTCTVYAMNASGLGKTVRVTVKQQLPTRVKVSSSSWKCYIGYSKQLYATVSPSNVAVANRGVTWYSSNNNVAIVSDTGVVYSMNPGTCYIYARSVNGKTARCKITVVKRAVKSVSIVNPYGTLLVGGTYKLGATVLPANATNTGVKWALSSSSYRNYVSINATTGEIYCKKAGKVKITATALDGSRKKATITLYIASTALNSLSVSYNGSTVLENQTFQLAYGTTATVTALAQPAMYVEWSSSDARIASVSSAGVITATGSGTATITAKVGGSYFFSFYVQVPRDASAPKYRALVIGQYQTSGQVGYLSFSKNSTWGVRDALKASSINGERYSVTYASNLSSASAVTDTIASTFSAADENDVSVIYMLSHGTKSGDTYRWHLSGSGFGVEYVTGGEIVSAMKGIKGNVILVICSCYSGGDESVASSVPGMVRTADRNAPAGTSYSVICSSDGLNVSSYSKTYWTLSYDFYSNAACRAMGWDLSKDASISMAGDSNGDGYLTVSEFASSAKSLTSSQISAYIAKYGSSSFYGPASKTQVSTWYISPNAANIAIIGD